MIIENKFDISVSDILLSFACIEREECYWSSAEDSSENVLYSIAKACVVRTYELRLRLKEPFK